MKINFSVIIPTHNRDILLDECINSVLSQKLLPKEIIVSDNLCNSNTKKLVENKNSKSSIDIIYLGHKLGGKGAISRNLAAKIAKYNFIAFIDDDDLWMSDYLYEISDFIKKNNSNLVYTWLYELRDNNLIIGKKIPNYLKYYDFFLLNPGSIVSNLVVNKNIFNQMLGFDENTNPPYDKDFIIRYLFSHKSYHVYRKPLVIFRNHNFKKESLNYHSLYKGYINLYNKHENRINLFIKLLLKLKINYFYYVTQNNSFMIIIITILQKIINLFFRLKYKLLLHIR